MRTKAVYDRNGRITSYVLTVNNGIEDLYAGTAWTLQAAQEVLATYAARGWDGWWVEEQRN